MRIVLAGIMCLAFPAFVLVACSQDTGSAASSSSGMGGAPNCDGAYLVTSDKDGGHPCDICLRALCCAEISKCRDKACIECANFPELGCGDDAKAARRCAYEFCRPTCAPSSTPSHSSGAGGATSSTSSG